MAQKNPFAYNAKGRIYSCYHLFLPPAHTGRLIRIPLYPCTITGASPSKPKEILLANLCHTITVQPTAPGCIHNSFCPRLSSPGCFLSASPATTYSLPRISLFALSYTKISFLSTFVDFSNIQVKIQRYYSRPFFFHAIDRE